MMFVVPAISWTKEDGTLDYELTASYTRLAQRTWVDSFILSGSTTGGNRFTAETRAEVLDVWQGLVPTERLIACCWEQDDVHHAAARGIVPMIVMQGLDTIGEALAFLEALPDGAYVYSHPAYSRTVLDAGLAHLAARHHVMPAGAKLAKTAPEAINAMRAAATDHPVLLDGSSRHIAASLTAGASGIVATPLAILPDPFPLRDIQRIQACVDTTQAIVDRLATRDRRNAYIVDRARAVVE